MGDGHRRRGLKAVGGGGLLSMAVIVACLASARPTATRSRPPAVVGTASAKADGSDHGIAAPPPPTPAPPPRVRPRPVRPAPVPPAPDAMAEDVAADTPPLPASQLRAALDQWLAAQGAAGSVAVGVALVGDDRPRWTGEAHLGDPLVRVGDEYGILSITKTFTEALVLREVASGHIGLDAPVPPIPGVDGGATDAAVTPRMLLQHTSGLVNYPNAVGYDPTRAITPREIVSLALQSPRLSPPGEKAAYSNTNFHWLGLLLEQVTGRPYGELVADLAAELGLDHTRLDPTGRPGWVGYASGGLWSTVDDIARWGAALFTPGRVLPSAQLNGLTTVGDAGASLGLWPLCPCATDGDGTHHEAALRQAVANGGFFYYPDRQLVIVIHFQPSGSWRPDAAALARSLREVFNDRPAG